MEEINGEFVMKGCSEDDPSRINTSEQLVGLLSSIGFLPLFSNGIRFRSTIDGLNQCIEDYGLL